MSFWQQFDVLNLFLFLFLTDVNDPPNNLTLSTPHMMENSAERVLISPIVLYDQDSNLPSCTLLDSAGERVKVIGTNLVVGPRVTDYESLPPPQQFSITLNCSDEHGMFIWKSPKPSAYTEKEMQLRRTQTASGCQ